MERLLIHPWEEKSNKKNGWVLPPKLKSGWIHPFIVILNKKNITVGGRNIYKYLYIMENVLEIVPIMFLGFNLTFFDLVSFCL